MIRIIRIVLFAIFFILIFWALSNIYDSCNSPKIEASDKSPNSLISASVEEGTEDLADEFFEDNEPVLMESKAEEHKTEKKVDEDDRKTNDASINDINSPKDQIKPNVGPSKNLSAEGRYIVVAGSYQVKSNAESMVSRLKMMGYPNAEVLVFDGSRYFTVSAARFRTMSPAKSLTTELKQKGIDSYVHARQE